MPLNANRDHSPRLAGASLALAVLALAGLVVGLSLASPLIGLPFASQQARAGSEISLGNRTHLDWSDGWRSLDLRARGRVTLTPDATAVVSLAPRSRLKIRERQGLKVKSVSIRPGRDGEPEYSYYVYGLRREFDEEAEEWLAEVLPAVVDNTGIGAEARARDLLATRGVDAVLDKISEIDSDSTQVLYFKVLFAEGDLDASAFSRVLRHLGSVVSSEYYLAATLKEALDHAHGESLVAPAFFSVIGEIRSDHYRHEVLSRLLKAGDLDDDSQIAVAEAAADMSSDHYRAAVLSRLAQDGLAVGPATAYLDATSEIRSSVYRQRALQALLKSSAEEDAVVAGVLRQAAGIDSDHYLAALLVELAPEVATRPALRQPFFQTVGEISSDHYRHQALAAVLAPREPAPDVFVATLDVLRDMAGEHYKSELLTRLAAVAPPDAAARDRYLDTASSLRSDHYLTQVLQAFLRRSDLDEGTLRRTLQVAKEHIDSAHYRGQVLDEIAGRLLVDEL